MRCLILSAVLFSGASFAQGGPWSQCGGQGWTGPTTCVSGYVCTYSNPWYSQCIPGTAPPSSSSSSSSRPTTLSTVTSTGPTTTPSLTQFAGVNIAGFDFGCGTDGTCIPKNVYPPLSSLGGNDGLGQMQHFVQDDHLNVFRLPVGWQYLVGNDLGGPLDQTNFTKYDELVQACLSTGAHCIIDIHNYARWNGGIIGQGGPTNDQFASLWSQLATKYASTANVIFGIMNEPHDVPSVTTWATSVQAAVTAIRNSGATSQLILLPGNDWTSAAAFVSDGSGPALLGVKNPDGSTTNLIFDVHKYLDSDNSGTHAECTTNNVDVFTSLATWLRQNKRQAFLTETGGGNVASCETDLCQQVAYLNANSDVYLGYIGWAAGNFDSTYVLDEVPVHNGNTWTDTALVAACIAR